MAQVSSTGGDLLVSWEGAAYIPFVKLMTWGSLVVWSLTTCQLEDLKVIRYILGGGLRHVLFSSLPGEMIQFD